MITKPAIVINGIVCSIDKPYRHADIYKRLNKDRDNRVDSIHEGFLATDVRYEDQETFLFRDEAMGHAKACGQVGKEVTDKYLNTDHLW